MFTCKLRQRSNVGHFRQGIGRRFQKQDTGFRPYRLAPGVQIRQWNITHIHAEGRNVFVKQHHGAAKNGAG